MKATINGEQHDLAEDVTLAQVLQELEIGTAGVAVALNGRIVPRAMLAGHCLREGDAMEIIHAVAGG